MDKVKVIVNSDGKIIGIAANKFTEELYKKEGCTIVVTKTIDRNEVPINKVQFEVLSVCRDGYECTGEKTKRKGDIISILDDFFYTELSETKDNDDYIPFVDFIANALEYHEDESYIGDCSIELLADIFISELRTKTQEFEVLKASRKVNKKEIVKYLSSLYINKGYIDDYGYDFFCAMR